MPGVGVAAEGVGIWAMERGDSRVHPLSQSVAPPNDNPRLWVVAKEGLSYHGVTFRLGEAASEPIPQPRIHRCQWHHP